MCADKERHKRYGIMGGTFDPIHVGHLVTAEQALYEFSLDEVIFVPTGKPPHKANRQITDADHRFLMCFLSIVSNAKFTVSRLEIEREGYSYTIDTLYLLREKLGGNVELYFITGADAVREILTWHRYEEVLDNCHIVAATRPGYSLDHFLGNCHPALEQHRSSIHMLEVPAMAISSTNIRTRVRNGRPIKYLVHDSVENYIYKNRLYM